MRAVIGRCPLSIREQMHEWRHCVAWFARVIKVQSVCAGKDFLNSGQNKTKSCSALVEDFNDKKAAEYQSERKAFNSAKHARSLPGKTIEAV